MTVYNERLPLFPIRDQVVLPFQALHLEVVGQAEMAAVSMAMTTDERTCLFVRQRHPSDAQTSCSNFHRVGVVGSLAEAEHDPGLRVRPRRRAKLRHVIAEGTGFLADVEIDEQEEEIPGLPRPENASLIGSALANIKNLLHRHENPGWRMRSSEMVARPLLIALTLTRWFRLSPNEAQALLDLDEPMARLVLVNQHLEREITAAESEGLEHALFLLDDGNDDADRARVAFQMFEAFGRRCVREYVQKALVSRPFLPRQMASLPSAIELAGRDPLNLERPPTCSLEAPDKPKALLRRLESLQGVIGEVCRAFDALPARLFGEQAGDRVRVREALVREGAFRALTMVREDPTSLASAVAALLTAHVPSAELGSRMFREIISAWSKPLLEAALMKGGRPPLTVEEEARRLEEGFIADELNSINRAYDEEPVEVPASLMRAHLYRRGGMNDQALWDYNEILKADPDDVAARIARAETLRDVGRLDDALCDYDDLLARAPDRVDARNGRAEVLRRGGRFDEALAELDGVLAGAADDGVAGLSRAVVLTALGRHEEALRAYEALTTKDPEIIFGRARALARMGRYHDALAELPNPPRDWRNYLARAMISLRAGDLDAAEAVFELGARCLLTPEREPFRMALATVRLRSDDVGGGPSVVDVDLLDQTIAERTFRGY